MNFFQHQDDARRRTTRLVVLFVIAVVLIVAAVNVAVYGVMRVTGMYDVYARDAAPVLREDHQYPGRFAADRTPGAAQVFLGATCVTLLIIAGGSLYKTASLARGGPAVAQLLGGRPLAVGGAGATKERVLQNVVEEMSIASGVPVPQVYVLDDEEGINAFAAGFTTDDAVIGVTRGCLEQLNRDELQGVIAHEFSHILHGDMRLNLRLIGVLHGILVIALVGLMLLRTLAYSSSSGRGFSSRRSNRGGGGWLIVVIALSGAALVVIGYIGVFFGRLIQAAVSRQREYLADASAVQFTRNPRGLAGALKKIAAHRPGAGDGGGAGGAGSRIGNAHALETAHLFFGSPVRFSFTRLLATHPPLEQRIRALDPTFDGRFDLGGGATQVIDETPESRRGEVLAGMLSGAAASAAALAAARRVPLDPSRVADRAGEVTRPDIRYADGLLDALPPLLAGAAHDPHSARAVALALLASHDADVRRRQLAAVERGLEPAAVAELLRLLPAVDALGDGARLPLLDVALPALRQLSPGQASRFRALVRSMIESDGRVTLFEYALHRIVEKQLAAAAEDPRQAAAPAFFAANAVRDEAAVILSALAAASTAETDGAFAAGASAFDPSRPPAMVPVTGLASIDAALRKLARASPAVKKRLVDSFAHTVAADGEVSLAEAELLRATAATLDVPLPPLFRGIDGASAAD